MLYAALAALVGFASAGLGLARVALAFLRSVMTAFLLAWYAGHSACIFASSRWFRSITMAFAFSALIGVASAGFALASIALAACSKFVTRGVSRGAGSSGLAGSGARESVSGSIIDSPHFQVNSKSNSLSCADHRCSLLLCLSIP